LAEPLLAELVAGAGEQTLNGFRGFAGEGGHLFGRALFPIAPEENEAVGFGQGVEDGGGGRGGAGLVEDGVGAGAGFGDGFGGVFGKGEVAEAVAVVIFDFVAGDAEEPGLERGLAAVLGETAPGGEENVLDEIVDELKAGLEAGADVAIEGVGAEHDELGDGLAIAREYSLGEGPICILYGGG